LAQAGHSCVITRRGQPCAAIVPIQNLQAGTRRPSLLALRGTGSGLWGPHSAQELA
jgi:antitoxin (DNA-binding transcriptional repressor) of toxin-antitoxin stability system